MRTLINIYTISRFPIGGLILFGIYLCPLAAGSINVVAMLLCAALLFAGHEYTNEGDTVRNGLLCIAGAFAAFLLAIGATCASMLWLGWFDDTRFMSVWETIQFHMWIFGTSVVFIIAAIIPALETLRYEMVRHRGDIDL